MSTPPSSAIASQPVRAHPPYSPFAPHPGPPRSLAQAWHAALALVVRGHWQSRRLTPIDAAPEHPFRSLLDGAPDAMVVASEQGTIVLVNMQMEQMFGYHRQELLGQTTDMLLPPRFRGDRNGRRNGFFAGLRARPMSAGTELYGLRKDGSEFPMAVSLSPLETEDGIVGVAAVRDITAQKEYDRRLEIAVEEAQEASRAKSMFLSTVSHEIRTPMNAILGYAQLMARDPQLSDASKANLRVIRQSGEHLMGLITDILDMSKIEAGRTELHLSAFHLPQLVESLAAMFRLSAQARSLRFDVQLDGEPVDYVIGDEGKIRQVLINLLGNAIKFTAHGHIRLHITLQSSPPHGLQLTAEVADTGPGLTREEQTRLFQPFNQFKRGLKPLEGTGLGLSIGRSHARLMGGDLDVATQVGEGSCFRLRIPLEPAAAGFPVRGPASPPAAETMPHGEQPRYPATLAQLPTRLLRQLQMAVQQGEKELLDQLVQQAEALDPAAASLRTFAENYDYDTLTLWLQQADLRTTDNAS